MPKFSQTSLERLETCDERLIKLFNEVVKYYDCTIICGHRNKQDQNKAFNEGKSRVNFPNSKHNTFPSKAVDVAPWFFESPHIRWNDVKSFVHFAGFVKGIAASMGIKIRWGGDWDSDWDMTDENFLDYPHFEIKED